MVFNEILGECIKNLQYNLDKIGISKEYYRIIKGEYNRTVIALSKRDLKFDIIFLDPPYQLLEYANPLKVIYKRNILKQDGIIVLERPKRIKFIPKFFDNYKTQVLGTKVLDFYRFAPGEKI